MNLILGTIAITLSILLYLLIRWIDTSRQAEYDREALELSELDIGEFPYE